MKLQILSDIHNEFSILPVPQTDADVVVLAGDIDVGSKAIEWALGFEKPVLYVLGNHEFYGGHYERVREQVLQAAEGTPIQVLENQAVTIGNVRFLGSTLWTNFELFGQPKSSMAIFMARMMMNDFRHIRTEPDERQLKPEDTLRFHQEAISFLEEALRQPFDGKTVVITHHAPSLQSVHDRFRRDLLSAAFASDLSHLMGDSVDLWIHGHVHNSNDYTVRDTRVVSNPRGYERQGNHSPENPYFKPDFVIEV